MEINRLSDRLRDQTRKHYGLEEELWVQFVQDHKLYLRENSPYKSFTTLDLFQYKYRPEEFYKANRGDITQTWIFLFVNDIRDASGFNESISHLWVVDPDVISKLRKQFESSAQHQALVAAS